jgi:hypothetical protein
MSGIGADSSLGSGLMGGGDGVASLRIKELKRPGLRPSSTIGVSGK